MLKKILFLSWSVWSLALSFPAFSQSACGGQVVSDNDCSTNPRGFSESCCTNGVVIGVGYNDMGKRGGGQSDVADAVSAICYSPSQGSTWMPSDNQNVPVMFQCDPKRETFVGTACKDLGNNDELDGCTALCQTIGKSGYRRVYNPDLESNTERSYVEHFISSPKKVVGIVYKDMTNGPHQGGSQSSDQADCASIVAK